MSFLLSIMRLYPLIVANITDIVDALSCRNSASYVVYRLLYFSLNGIFLFSAVISATDSVAASTFIKVEQEPKLFAILFGDGAILFVLFYIGYLRKS
jgi:hypothetical protein